MQNNHIKEVRLGQGQGKAMARSGKEEYGYGMIIIDKVPYERYDMHQI